MPRGRLLERQALATICRAYLNFPRRAQGERAALAIQNNAMRNHWGRRTRLARRCAGAHAGSTIRSLEGDGKACALTALMGPDATTTTNNNSNNSNSSNDNNSSSSSYNCNENRLLQKETTSL